MSITGKTAVALTKAIRKRKLPGSMRTSRLRKKRLKAVEQLSKRNNRSRGMTWEQLLTKSCMKYHSAETGRFTKHAMFLIQIQDEMIFEIS